MSRKQRACLTLGFLLLVVSAILPPWQSSIGRGTRFAYSNSSYGFLFTHSGGTLELSRLLAEWLLIVLVSGGLFVAFRKSEESQSKPSTWATPKDDPLAALLGPDQKPTERNLPPYKPARQWKRKFIIPAIITFSVCAVGLAYYVSRRIVRDLPAAEDSKLAGGASITNYGRFVWNAYNGSNFVLTEVRVSISVFDERGTAIISNRVYRVPAYDFYPQQTKELGADVGFTLGQDQKWGWVIVGAKGRPE